MENLRWYEELQAVLAYRYARKLKFKQKINTIKYGDIKKPKMTTGKKLTIFLLVNMVVIQLYAMYMMMVVGDLSSLPALITTVVGEVATLLVYQVKSSVENRTGGITYEMAMRDKETEG